MNLNLRTPAQLIHQWAKAAAPFALGLSLFLAHSKAHAQGCSSAGFCTMGALKADQNFSHVKQLKFNYVEINQLLAYSGLGEEIHATTLDASFSLGEKNQFQIRLPYVWVNGPLANTQGVGDVYLAFTRTLVKERDYSINATIGTKIPRSSTNLATPDGLPLPLYYSPSLGTNDLIVGASYIDQKWLLGIGYQAPAFNTRTDNQFAPEAWVGTERENQAERYDRSVDYQRGADLMIRLERNFRYGRINYFIGAMPVFRFTADEVTNSAGERELLNDSRGLSLTGIAGGGYSFNAFLTVKLFYGHTLLSKEVNPDGLLKTSVITLAAKYKF